MAQGFTQNLPVPLPASKGGTGLISVGAVGTALISDGSALTYESLPRPNSVIGGNFSTNPWQRNTTFSAVASNTYTADRFVWTQSGVGVVSIIKTADSPTASQAGVYATDCLHIDVTTNDASIGATDYYTLQYRMEGLDSAIFGFGQTGTRTVTLSFWHKHTKTGIYCVALGNSAVNRGYTSEYTQDVSDTWEKATVTITVDTTGTWLYNIGIGLTVYFTVAAGSNYQQSNNTWVAANALATANQVNGMDSTSNNFKLQFIKLESGSVATPYPIEIVSDVLARCQRYWQKTYNDGTAAATSTTIGSNEVLISTAIANGTNLSSVRLPVTMRSGPGVTLYSVTGASGKVRALNNATDVTASAASISSQMYACQNASGGALTAGYNYAWHHVCDIEL